MSENINVDSVILELFDKGAVKTGNYRLKSGIDSPIYIDLRILVTYPQLLKNVGDLITKLAIKNGIEYDILCGVPYTALPIATCISLKNNIPMVMRRKEAKDYGTKKLIEGVFSEGAKCLVIEDLVTSGSSTMETVEVLKSVGLVVTDAIVLLDREQGGKENLMKRGIKLHSVCPISHVLKVLERESRISSQEVGRVMEFLKANSCVIPVASSISNTKLATYAERAALSPNIVAKRLFDTMQRKRSNLAVAVDVTTSAKLLEVAKQLGPFICLLKTHIDILSDFDSELPEKLSALAKEHSFLIMEDRKYSDIGNTVKMQFTEGMHRVSSWADLVTAHALPGPGLVSSMKAACKDVGCILVAEMSSEGTLTNNEYAAATVKMAMSNPDFVAGVVCQSRLIPNRGFIQMTPGVNLTSTGDSAGQQYVSPREAILIRGADIIIVGRGIVDGQYPAILAEEYRSEGWKAYEETITKS